MGGTMGFMDKIFKPKWKDEDFVKRYKAVKKLKDQKILIEIAKNDPNYTVRSAAVENITDENALIDLALNDSSGGVQCGAIKKINDETVLKDIVKNLKNSEMVRETAIENINDVDFLIDVAKTDVSDEIRRKATDKIDIEKINDDNILADIAKNGANVKVRQEALEKIKDKKIASEIESIESNKLKYLEKLEDEFDKNTGNPYAFSYDPDDQKPFWKWKMDKAKEIEIAARSAGYLDKAKKYEGAYEVCKERYSSK